MFPKHSGFKKCLNVSIRPMVLITRKISELESGTFKIFFISINEKHSLKSVIQNAEYEIGVHQNIFYMIAVLHYCSKS